MNKSLKDSSVGKDAPGYAGRLNIFVGKNIKNGQVQIGPLAVLVNLFFQPLVPNLYKFIPLVLFLLSTVCLSSPDFRPCLHKKLSEVLDPVKIGPTTVLAVNMGPHNIFKSEILEINSFNIALSYNCNSLYTEQLVLALGSIL